MPCLIGIPRIRLTSSSQNTSLISCLSQSPVTGSINSETLVSTMLPRGVIGRLVTPSGIHGFDQISIRVPSPTRQIKPCFRASNPRTMLRHEYEMPGFSVAFTSSPSGKYLARRTCAHKDSGFMSNRQPCLASIAILKRCRSLNPKPSVFASGQLLCILFSSPC